MMIAATKINGKNAAKAATDAEKNKITKPGAKMNNIINNKQDEQLLLDFLFFR